MFVFRKPRRWCGLLPDKNGWFSVYCDGKQAGFVRRESAGRWIGSFDRKIGDGANSVIGPTRDAAAEALQWRAHARKQGTGEA